ncbi:MAG: hydrogenase [Oligoflexales bacterium]|nr:hydrogenase [Oligoflexales bacterium]
MEYVINILFVVIVFLNLMILGTIKIDLMIRFVVFQGIILSVLPLVFEGLEVPNITMAVLMFIIKGIAIPSLLYKAMSGVRIKREDSPNIGSTASMLLGLAITGISLVLAGKYIPQNPETHPMIIPIGISTFVAGVILLVSRRKAFTQVIGYLVFDNAIFIFGMLIVSKMQFVVEMGILLDLLVCIFIMGIVLHDIAEHYTSLDTRKMNYLKE